MGVMTTNSVKRGQTRKVTREINEQMKVNTEIKLQRDQMQRGEPAVPGRCDGAEKPGVPAPEAFFARAKAHDKELAEGFDCDVMQEEPSMLGPSAAVPLTDEPLTQNPTVMPDGGHNLYARDPKDVEALIDGVHSRLLRMLGDYGCYVSPKHASALRKVIQTYVEISQGFRRGRVAFPLPCGTGKTTSIIALCLEAHERGFFLGRRDDRLFNLGGTFSIGVSAEKIEALCKIKRELVEGGVPEELIGLRHSYSWDADMAEAFIKNKVPLTPNYASEPATKDNEDRPILLTAHAMIKNSRDGLDSFYRYHGRIRDLTCWDESLIKARGKAISRFNWEKELGTIKAMVNSGSPHLAPINRAVELVLALDDKAQKQREIDGELQRLNLAQILSTVDKVIEEAPTEEVAEMAITKAMLKLSDEDLVVADVYGRRNTRAFIQWELVVPKALKNVVILDASSPIRKLCAADETITDMSRMIGDLLSFKKVTINQMYFNSGRYTMDRIARQKEKQYAGLLDDLVEVFKEISEDEGIIVFCFKPRPYAGEVREVDFWEALKTRMAQEQARFDKDSDVWKRLDAEAQIGNAPSRPRFAVLHHGAETSSNEHRYAKHVVFIGVLNRDDVELTATMVAQMEGGAALTKDMMDAVKLGEACYRVHQGANRANCRVPQGIDKDTGLALAGETSIWVIHPDRRMGQFLQKVMQGAQFQRWEPKYLRLNSSTKDIEARLRRYLNSRDCEERYPKTVSTSKLRKELGWGDQAVAEKEGATRHKIKAALSTIDEDPDSGWKLVKRSLVRTANEYGFEAH